ncbi:MAG TPA: DNA-3-methyladenine glycosylase [Candidatus Acidoferrales bacterium]|nr:DNA-3-methyladenine glycosylase [Candidatus Acidoferrales bacterium]
MRKAVNHLKKSDAVLASVITRVGACNVTYREPTFEALARSIVFQQLSTKAARTIYGRFEEAAGGKVTPEAIQNMSVSEMRQCGLSKQKIGYIRDLAEHALSGKVDFDKLPTMTDEEVIIALTDIKGVGVWTAHMFLIFALRRPNVLPVGDLGVRTAIQRLYGKRKPPTPAQMEKIAANWHPYCSYAAWYLWRSLEFPKASTAKSTTEARRHGGKAISNGATKRRISAKVKSVMVPN